MYAWIGSEWKVTVRLNKVGGAEIVDRVVQVKDAY